MAARGCEGNERGAEEKVLVVGWRVGGFGRWQVRISEGFDGGPGGASMRHDPNSKTDERRAKIDGRWAMGDGR